MSDIRYSYGCVPTIRRFSESQKFIRGLMGPFGSGKSSGCIIKLIEIAAAQKPWSDGMRRARFACIRNTYPQLRDTTIKTFHRWLPDGHFGNYSAQHHEYLIDKLAPDLRIEVLFRALDRPEHVANLLSLDLTAAWANEAREMPWQVIQALQGRVGRYPPIAEAEPVDACVMLDSNPPDSDSWWYQLFEETKPGNAEIFKQPAGDSEQAENLPNLPKDYYKNLSTGVDENFIKVYVRGEYGFVREGKAVYPEYNDALHCVDLEPQPALSVYRGWDFGLTPAVVYSQITSDGRWNTFDELVAEDLFIDQFADHVQEYTARTYPWAKSFIDIGDPSGTARSPLAKRTEEQSCFDVLHGKGIMVQEGEQTLTMRLGSVKRALTTIRNGKPQLSVHSRCKVLRKGYQGRYQYRKLKVSGAAERYTDEPDKNEYSHPHDANQYIAAKLFGAALMGREAAKDKPLPLPRTGIV